MAYCDSLIGTLLDDLDRLNLSGNTVITVVGDHGESSHEHDEVGHGFLLYETTLRVPWILCLPRGPSAAVGGAARLVDVAPTLLEACALETPGSFQGEPLLKEARADARLPERATYIETYYPRVTHNWSELIGWRRGAWKYIRGPRPELYNLSADPQELNNLHESEPERAAALSAELDAYLQRIHPHRLSSPYERPDEETLERLRSLGYVGDGVEEAAPQIPGWELGLVDPKDAIGPWNRRQEANAFYRVGLVNFQAGLYDRALEWAERSLLADSTRMDALLLKAESLAALNRLEPALESYELLTRSAPGDVAGWIGLGIVRDRLGRPAAAREAFARALELDPESPEANFDMGALLVRQGRLAEAVPYYETVRRLEPADVALRADLARIYLRLSRPEDARVALQEAHALDPTHPGTLLLLAKLTVAQGDTASAREYLRSFLAHHPDRPEAAEVQRILEALGRGS